MHQALDIEQIYFPGIGSRWRILLAVSLGLVLFLGVGYSHGQADAQVRQSAGSVGSTAAGSGDALAAPDLAALCRPEAVSAIAARLSPAVTVKEIANGPKFTGGATFVPAKAQVPAFCQVTGSFVTNPKTGKTANFLATFPANWNGKYLQMGCSGHCGQFAVSDPAMPFATITNQGYPFEPIIKGYASFATDEGHEGFAGGTWAINASGEVDEEALQDFYYRATQVLATVGKAFTRAFYSQAMNAPRDIDYAYFNGCSGGGRDAYVAASYFPEEFDGIIGGSAYDGSGGAFQMAGIPLSSIRSAGAQVPAALISLIDPIVKARCDKLDGVEDGLIQNPAACDFRPELHLPRCNGDTVMEQCFSEAQIETISTALTAVTDEKGNVVQPGFSVSEIQPATFVTPPRPADLAARDPFPGSDSGDPAGTNGYWPLADAVLKVFVHKNDPEFYTRDLVSFGAGGEGAVTDYRIIVPAKEVDAVKREMRMAIGHFPENLKRLLELDRKFLLWHNMSDQVLTPYMSVNYYKRLAKQYGGYEKLQDNVRLFALPGTPHCSMGGIGPNSFDALSAIENWVENGEAPDALVATLHPANAFGMLDFSKPAGRTMPLCKFPVMARYSGKGDVDSAENWSCPGDDTRMLSVGESGRQAGVIE
ncbi:MAG: tannase/feruloyl esterase family alpha/beta hydrolase [Halioglobus sp.]|nr:tannase/feruloyl esterase family alpha/beta hydrolase [Halioglobus sp.]